MVIPSYNHGHLIAEALAAICRQTTPPFEVVVVDDGSTDDSLARLQSLAADMPWLRVHRHPENRGVNAACNTGLDLVSGDFVLFSAADDRLSPEMVERAFVAAAAFPLTGIVFSDHAEMSSDGSNPRVIPLDLPKAVQYFSANELVRLMQSHFLFSRLERLVQRGSFARPGRLPARCEVAWRPAGEAARSRTSCAPGSRQPGNPAGSGGVPPSWRPRSGPTSACAVSVS